jgi:hypothetical protein
VDTKINHNLRYQKGFGIRGRLHVRYKESIFASFAISVLCVGPYLSVLVYAGHEVLMQVDDKISPITGDP